MGRFRSPQNQADHAIRQHIALGKPRHKGALNDGKIHSLGTARTYTDSLSCVAEFLAEHRLDRSGRGLSSLTKETALSYLYFRSELVGQKQLDKDRQALQLLLGEKIQVVESELEQVLRSRAYSNPQINLIASAQSSKYELSTYVASDAGLRAHELLTILPLPERLASAHRLWSESRFYGRVEVQRYSVIGKGGLTREVALSTELALQLESMRLAKPRVVTDRCIYYTQYYNLGGGKGWSDSFSKAAQRELGWSEGAHGVRHTYAQSRMRVLLSEGVLFENALGIVSQELGHFRPEITMVYMR